jgi:hypothetical protein
MAVAGSALDAPPIDGLTKLLEARRVRIVYTSYWLAYRISFDTGERVLGIPVNGGLQLGQVRIPEYLDVAKRLRPEQVAWIFDARSGDEHAFRELLRRRNIGAVRTTWDTLIVYSGLTYPLLAPLMP